MLDRHTILLSRFLTSHAVDAAADAQGRVAIPQALRQWAGLDRDAVIAGAGTRIEIWSQTRWAEYNERVTDAALLESAEALGLA
jgi:MraZ protein